MAGPSIMVKILGDVSGLGKSFDGAATKGQTAASKMHSAFSGMLGILEAALWPLVWAVLKDDPSPAVRKKASWLVPG